MEHNPYEGNYDPSGIFSGSTKDVEDGHNLGRLDAGAGLIARFELQEHETLFARSYMNGYRERLMERF